MLEYIDDPKKYISSDKPIILDIGCHDGRDTKQFADRYPNAQIFSFEVDKRAHYLFEKKLPKSQYPNITLVKTAVAAIDGTTNLYISDPDKNETQDFSCSNSIHKPRRHLIVYDNIPFSEPVIVECCKLDTWYKKQFGESTPIIDFIWADVQGAEEDIIVGGMETITRYTKMLYTEYSNQQLYKDQITKSDILSLLPTFVEVGDSHPYDEYYATGDVLLRNTLLT